MGRVVVYLDVDGVLNALSTTHAFGDGVAHRVEGFELLLSPRQGRRLATLDAEVRWLTTWGRDAARVGALIGLGTLAVAAEPPDAVTSSGPWKLDCVRQQVSAEGRPFVWIDDNAIGRTARRWAETVGVPHLLVTPDPLIGLRPEELDAVERFVADVR